MIKKSGKNYSMKKSKYFTRRDKAFVSPKPIDKHGDYDGTDVGFTSKSIQDPKPSKPREHSEKNPLINMQTMKRTNTMEYLLLIVNI